MANERKQMARRIKETRKEFNEANTRIRELEKEVRTLRRVKHWLICWKVGV